MLEINSTSLLTIFEIQWILTQIRIFNWENANEKKCRLIGEGNSRLWHHTMNHWAEWLLSMMKARSETHSKADTKNMHVVCRMTNDFAVDVQHKNRIFTRILMMIWDVVALWNHAMQYEHFLRQKRWFCECFYSWRVIRHAFSIITRWQLHLCISPFHNHSWHS